MASVGAPNMQKEQMFGLAEKEMEYRVDLFNRLTQTCFNKCIEKRHKEAELNMGDNSCIDRCVSKYWQGFDGLLCRPMRHDLFERKLRHQLLASYCRHMEKTDV